MWVEGLYKHDDGRETNKNWETDLKKVGIGGLNKEEQR